MTAAYNAIGVNPNSTIRIIQTTTGVPILYDGMNNTMEAFTTPGNVLDDLNCNKTVSVLKYVEFVLAGIVQAIFCFFGLITNTLSLIVWWQDGRRNVTISLLRVLSIVDNLFLLCVLLYHCMPDIYDFLGVLPGQYNTLVSAVPYIWPLLWTFKCLTVWCIVVMSVVRFNIVCNPLKASANFSPRRVTQYVAVLFLVITLLNLPHWFERQVAQQVDPCTNVTSNAAAFSPIVYNQTYQMVYLSGFTIIIFYLIPLSIILHCSIKLIRILKEADTYRKKLVVNSVQISHNVTKMLLTVIIIFVVCETPEFLYAVLYFMNYIDLSGPLPAFFKKYREPIMIYKAVSDLMFTLNSSMNFFVYYLMARKFRRILKDIILCKKARRPKYLREFSSTMSQRTASLSMNSSSGSIAIGVFSESPMPPRSTEGHERTFRRESDIEEHMNHNWKGQTSLTVPKQKRLYREDQTNGSVPHKHTSPRSSLEEAKVLQEIELREQANNIKITLDSEDTSAFQLGNGS